jgi:hypothetical protein
MKFGTETDAVYRELLAYMGEVPTRFHTGEHALADEQQVLEGYKWVFSILQVATDVFLWGDSAKPRFVDIVGPYKKWGGDNTDAFYQYFPVDPRRTYRITGVKGDAAYLSLTVYGGPDDGHYSERIVFTINDRELDIAPDGSFSFVIGPKRPAGYDGAFRQSAEDAVAAITRDYMNDPAAGRRVEWNVECLDEPDRSWRLTDADVARRLRAVLTWLKDQSAMIPIPLGEPNQIDPPYPVPEVTHGWAAGDASYAMGSFDLKDDEALVMTGRFPECAFWNVCLWNQFLHTFNADYDRTTLNGGHAVPNPDGSYTVVVAAQDPGHPNWITQQGHPRGRIWWRWFQPSATPDPLEVSKIAIAEVVDTTKG